VSPSVRRNVVYGGLIGALVSIVVLAADAALAGRGTGAPLNLGTRNQVNHPTVLTGRWISRLVQITQSGTGPGLSLGVRPGVPPLLIESSGWINHLNPDLLDGVDSSRFVQGSGRLTSARTAEAPGAAVRVILGVPRSGSVVASCGATPGYRISLKNDVAGTPIDVWYADGTSPIGFATVAIDGTLQLVDDSADRIVRIEVATPDGALADMTVATHAGAGGCVFAARAKWGSPVVWVQIPGHSQNCPVRLSRTGRRCLP
jgi:hypothetical protein